MPSVLTEKFWYDGTWARADGHALWEPVCSNDISVTPSHLATKTFTATFSAGSEASDTRNPFYLADDTQAANPEARVYNLTSDGTNLLKTVSNPTPWTLPGTNQRFGGHVFNGWTAVVTGDCGPRDTKSIDLKVPAGYIEGESFQADLTRVFEAMAECGTEDGSLESNEVKFVPIWKSTNQDYYVFLCDNSADIVASDGGLHVSYSDTDQLFRPIADLPEGVEKPAQARWFATYNHTGSAVPVGLPVTYQGEGLARYGYAYKPGYIFSSWEIRGGLGTWSNWGHETVTDKQGVSNNEAPGTVLLSGYSFGDVALWPVLTEKKYTVTYKFPDTAELTLATSHGVTNTDQFTASEIFGTREADAADIAAGAEAGDELPGVRLATAAGKTVPYPYKFLGWTTTVPASGQLTQGVAPSDSNWLVNDADSHIWSVLDAAAWSDIYKMSSVAPDDYSYNQYNGSTVTLHSVWKSADTVTVYLGSNEPESIKAGGGAGSGAGATATQDGLAVNAKGATSALHAWAGNGLTYRASDAENALVQGVDTAYNAPAVLDYSANGFAIKAPSRVGYEFMGWGITELDGAMTQKNTGAATDKGSLKSQYATARTAAETEAKGFKDAIELTPEYKAATAEQQQAMLDAEDAKAFAKVPYVREHPENVTTSTGGSGAGEGTDTTTTTERYDVYSALFIKYTPAGGLTQTGTQATADTFELTQLGADAVSKIILDGAASTGTYSATWVAIWKAKEYDVSLRVPKSAIEADQDAKWKTATDASAGWYYAYERYSYWHEIDIPAYTEVKNSFTFEGWFDMQINGSKIAAGSPDADTQADLSADYKKNSLGKLMALDASGGASANPYHVTDATPGNIWLRYRNVQIGVTTPIGVIDLCANVGEAPYEVGGDGRELLEAPITFTTTGETSHAMRVASVECTVGDPDAKDYKDDALVADNILTKNTGYGDAKDTSYFWLSADPTVTYNDSGNYWYTSEDFVAAGKKGADGKDLDRLYFGFDAAGATTGGTGRNNVLNSSSADDKKYGAMADRLARLELKMPDAAAQVQGLPDYTKAGTGELGYDPYNCTYELPVMVPELDENGKQVIDESGETVMVESGQKAKYRTTTFWYGLDLRKCSIDETKVLALVERVNKTIESEGDKYEAGDEYVPQLAKLVFTFEAVAGSAPVAAGAAAAAN